MKTLHTPGPWHVDNTKPFYVFASGALAEQAGVTNGPFICNASTVDNARLIAAAPDLLDALRGLAHGMQWHIGQGHAVGMDAEYQRRALAAIAKATQ